MSDVTVNIKDNGPLLVQGPFKLVDGEGGEFNIDPSKPAIALCRCGASANKPFCDGAHNQCGFASSERAS